MFELLRQGGLIVWILLISGVTAFAVFVERALHLHRARIKTDDFLKGICNILGRKNIQEAIAICEDTPGPVAHIVKAAILHRSDSKDRMQAAVDDAGISEISRMERRLVVVATVAQLAPLFGLLGTVVGMVETLIAMQGNANLIQTTDVTSGMLHALVATAAGLTVAIPCHAAFNLLVVKIDRLVLDMERVDYWLGQGASASGTVASLIRKARAGGDASVSVGEEDIEARRAAEKAALEAKRKADTAALAAAAQAAKEAEAQAAAEAEAAKEAEAAAEAAAEAEEEAPAEEPAAEAEEEAADEDEESKS